MLTKFRRPLIIFSAIHIAIFLVIFASLGRLYFGAGELERFIANLILDGQMPYIDFPSEYPPLAFLSFLLPALFFRTSMAYSWAFATEMLLLDLVALALIAALASRLKLSVRNTLTIYTLLIIAVGPVITSRYDLLPAVLTLGALYAFVTGRNKLAWALIALGTAAKLYPIIIAPIFALYCLRERQYRWLMVGSATFLGVLLIVTIPWLILDAGSLEYFLRYHAERGLHSESSYGSALLVGQVLKLTQLQAGLTFGSWNISSPLADKLATLSPYISVGLLAITYIRYRRHAWRQANTWDKAEGLDHEATQRIFRYSSLAILVFLLSNKVLSPQYLIWLCLILPLVIGGRHHFRWLLFVIAGAFTQYIYPYHYIEFELGAPYLVFMLLSRNFLLAIMTLLLALPTDTFSSPEKTPVRNNHLN